MSVTVQKAASYHGKQMLILFEQTKQKAYYLASWLLDDAGKAQVVVAEAFNAVFRDLASSNIKTEKEFSDFVILKTGEYCRAVILKKDPKALRIPDERNFRINGEIFPKAGKTTDIQRIIAQFNDLQRFIFVMNNVSGCEENQIAAFLKLDTKTLNKAVADEEFNVQKILEALNKSSITYEDVKDEFIRQEKLTPVPAKLSDAVENSIADICSVYERQRQKKAAVITISVATVCAVVVALVSGFVVDFSKLFSGDEKGSASVDYVDSVEDITAEYYADIEIENYGNIKVALDADAAPKTVENFVSLANEGFYDGLTFHRIIDNFMIQGGDPDANGLGGSGVNITGEFAANGFENYISHTRGAISMARSDPYDSASSQFFIVQSDSTHLDGMYAGFGYVTEGMDIVDKICSDAEPTDGNGTIPKDKQPVIASIKITEITKE